MSSLCDVRSLLHTETKQNRASRLSVCATFSKSFASVSKTFLCVENSENLSTAPREPARRRDRRLRSRQMAESLRIECSEAKRKYDGCFNRWFEGYVAIATNVGTNDAARTKALKQSAAEFETKCGTLFREYRACVDVRRSSTCVR